jgi:hypothetical protein
MTQVTIVLLTLLFSLSGPAMERNAGCLRSSLAVEEGNFAYGGLAQGEDIGEGLTARVLGVDNTPIIYE